jgi:hypothetical protein
MNALANIVEILAERLWLPLLVVAAGWLVFHVACGLDPALGQAVTGAIHGLLGQVTGAVTGSATSSASGVQGVS